MFSFLKKKNMQILKKTLTVIHTVQIPLLSQVSFPSLNSLLSLIITVFDKKSLLVTLLMKETRQAVAYQIVNTVFPLS